MAHGERERFLGSPTAVATRIAVLGGSAYLFAATNLSRDYVSVLPALGSVYLSYGASVNATSTLAYGPLPISVYTEQSYTGPIYGTCASGASGIANVLDVGGGEG